MTLETLANLTMLLQPSKKSKKLRRKAIKSKMNLAILVISTNKQMLSKIKRRKRTRAWKSMINSATLELLTMHQRLKKKNLVLWTAKMKTLLTLVKPRFKSRMIRPKRATTITLVISEISMTLYRLQQTTLVLHKSTKEKKILKISTKLSLLLLMNSKLRQNRVKMILTHSHLKLTRTTRVKIIWTCLMTKWL